MVVSNFLTLATALVVALVLIPLLRLTLAPLWGGTRLGPRAGAAAQAGALAVFVAVAALLPMGGDGIAVAWSDARLGLGLVLAAGLLLVAMTEDYRRLGLVARLALQACFALTATLVGLRPSGVEPALLSCLTGTVLLVVCANAFRGLDATDGLAAGTACIVAAFLAVAANWLGAHEWTDLNLGLCGALLGLVAFDLAGGRFKASLGEAGCLFVGFLVGASLLRFSAAAIPGTRPALALVLALPVLEWIMSARRAKRGVSSENASAHHIYDLLLHLGLGRRQALILCWTAAGVSGLAMLRFLRLLG
jgi:UDP-N-acetylmuramyl pentapeptide phosphotransferase/UDP-N-acetylglucosamine-1-phosphate transferase